MQLPNLAELTAENIQAAYMDWLAKNSPEKIREDCRKTLDKSAEEILRKLLGFDKDSWGKWSLDHCNGRSGESAAGDYLRKHQSAAVNDWLATVKLPVMTAVMQKSMEAEAATLFQRTFKRHLEQHVETYAAEQAEAFFNTVIQSQAAQVATQMKALETLLQPYKD